MSSANEPLIRQVPLRINAPWKQIARVQAGYYLLTGIWPLVHMPSFLKVTGPKTDLWLVKTVAVLIVAIGAALGKAEDRPAPSPETRLLAIGSAAGLAAIDVIYVAKRRIRPIYLLDMLAEVALICGWAISRRANK